MSTGANHPRIRPVWSIWAILVGASAAGFLLAEGGQSGKLVTLLAVVLAAGKIHLIIGQYMELAWHHRPIRQLMAAWLLVVCAILVTTYLNT